LNYYAPLIESSCRCSTFPLGNKIETSNHFIQTDGLYQDLVRRGAKHIYAEFFIAMPLRFYDLEARQFVKVNVVWSADDLLKARDESGTLPQESYAVVYAAELRRIGPADCGESTVSLRDAQFVVLKLK